jgi:hypothetical protein
MNRKIISMLLWPMDAPQIIPLAAATSTDISLPDSAKKDKQI